MGGDPCSRIIFHWRVLPSPPGLYSGGGPRGIVPYRLTKASRYRSTKIALGGFLFTWGLSALKLLAVKKQTARLAEATRDVSSRCPIRRCAGLLPWLRVRTTCAALLEPDVCQGSRLNGPDSFC